MSFAAIAAGGVVLGAGAKIWQGASQKHQANKIAKNNKFPTETVNPLFAQNLAIAENAARVGLPQQQYNQASQNFQRNQAGVLRQFARTGGRGNLGGIMRAGNDATLGLDVADASARMANQRQTYGMRNQLAQQQNNVWDWNNKTPYMQNLAKEQALRGAGMQNQMGGFNDLSMLGQYALMGNQGNTVNFNQGNAGMGIGIGNKLFGNKYGGSQKFTNQYINGWSNPNGG